MPWYRRVKFWENRELEDPETVADYPIETVEEEEIAGQNRLMIAALAVAILAFAVLVVLTSTWAYRHYHKTRPEPVVVRPTFQSAGDLKPVTGPDIAVKPPKPAPSNSSKPAPTSPNKPAPSSPGKSSVSTNSSSVQTPQVLPNSGPGDVLAIFVGSVVLAATVHFLARARQVSA